jgi:hypothetical protein
VVCGTPAPAGTEPVNLRRACRLHARRRCIYYTVRHASEPLLLARAARQLSAKKCDWRKRKVKNSLDLYAGCPTQCGGARCRLSPRRSLGSPNQHVQALQWDIFARLNPCQQRQLCGSGPGLKLPSVAPCRPPFASDHGSNTPSLKVATDRIRIGEVNHRSNLNGHTPYNYVLDVSGI